MDMTLGSSANLACTELSNIQDDLDWRDVSGKFKVTCRKWANSLGDLTDKALKTGAWLGAWLGVWLGAWLGVCGWPAGRGHSRGGEQVPDCRRAPARRPAVRHAPALGAGGGADASRRAATDPNHSAQPIARMGHEPQRPAHSSHETRTTAPSP